MPSLKIHRKWGEKVCNFCSEEIDKLIDDSQQHDAGRYDKEIFREQIEHVSSTYGARGVEYYLLHHLLDMLKDELVSIGSKKKLTPEIVEEAIEWIKPEALEGYEAVWRRLVSRLKAESEELLEDIRAGLGFAKGIIKSHINRYCSYSLEILLLRLPPCVSVDSYDGAWMYEDVLKEVWRYVRKVKWKFSLEEIHKEIDKIVSEVVANYIKEKNKFSKCTFPKGCGKQLVLMEMSLKQCHEIRSL